MMLTLDDYVASQVQSGAKKSVFCGDAAVRHEEDVRPTVKLQLYHQGLIIANRGGKLARRINNGRHNSFVRCDRIPLNRPQHMECGIIDQSSNPFVSARTIRGGIIDQNRRWKLRKQSLRSANMLGVTMAEKQRA